MDFSDSPMLLSLSFFSLNLRAKLRKVLVMLVSSLADVSMAPIMCFKSARLFASSDFTCLLVGLLLAMSTFVPTRSVMAFEPTNIIINAMEPQKDGVKLGSTDSGYLLTYILSIYSNSMSLLQTVAQTFVVKGIDNGLYYTYCIHLRGAGAT